MSHHRSCPWYVALIRFNSIRAVANDFSFCSDLCSIFPDHECQTLSWFDIFAEPNLRLFGFSSSIIGSFSTLCHQKLPSIGKDHIACNAVYDAAIINLRFMVLNRYSSGWLVFQSLSFCFPQLLLVPCCNLDSPTVCIVVVCRCSNQE